MPKLLKDLRGLGEPPSLDGNDAEYQDFRFSFRIHLSLVSTVSPPLMDKCEVERNPIFLAGVKLLGDAHVKCCIQMYYSLALITKGSVRTLVQSVEGSNGVEAWRPTHSRCAPDTQNRQYALMQKIMMPAKHWCDHAEGFESGSRAWELEDEPYDVTKPPKVPYKTKWKVYWDAVCWILLKKCSVEKISVLANTTQCHYPS